MIEYKAGKKNVVADQLSRPVGVIVEEGNENWLEKSREEMNELQR